MSNKTNTSRKQKRVVGKSLEGGKAKAERKAKLRPNTKVAASQRLNRNGNTKSEYGNRKWIYRGVTSVNGHTVSETSEVEFKAFPKEQAEKILAKALERDDIVKGRLFYKKSEGNTEMRGIGIAFAAENGVKKSDMAQAA